jgi:hypothetical protein
VVERAAKIPPASCTALGHSSTFHLPVQPPKRYTMDADLWNLVADLDPRMAAASSTSCFLSGDGSRYREIKTYPFPPAIGSLIGYASGLLIGLSWEVSHESALSAASGL